jgi:hypothetical protein
MKAKKSTIKITKSPIKLFILLITIVLLHSCERNIETDKQKPQISLSIQGAFPKNCDTIYFGETFNLKVLFSDNIELGTFSIDIHHNFDRHSHSTDVNSCVFEQVKLPINPFTLIRDFNIPSGLTSHQTNIPVEIPLGNKTGMFDQGDYHFFISLTDKEGWSDQKGLSIKMLHR